MVSSGSGPVPEAHPGSGVGAGDDGDTPMDADSPSAAAQGPSTPIVVQVGPSLTGLAECLVQRAGMRRGC